MLLCLVFHQEVASCSASHPQPMGQDGGRKHKQHPLDGAGWWEETQQDLLLQISAGSQALHLNRPRKTHNINLNMSVLGLCGDFYAIITQPPFSSRDGLRVLGASGCLKCATPSASLSSAIRARLTMEKPNTTRARDRAVPKGSEQKHHFYL